MADEREFPIRKIDSTDAYSSSGNQSRHKKRKKQKKKCPDDTSAYFSDLTLSAEHAHELLRKAHSPYRFCVYREGGDIFIDLVILDENGKIAKVIKNNITHAEFSGIINRIETLDGFLIDCTA
jgi:hypothetical protein